MRKKNISLQDNSSKFYFKREQRLQKKSYQTEENFSPTFSINVTCTVNINKRKLKECCEPETNKRPNGEEPQKERRHDKLKSHLGKNPMLSHTT